MPCGCRFKVLSAQKTSPSDMAALSVHDAPGIPSACPRPDMSVPARLYHRQPAMPCLLVVLVIPLDVAGQNA